MRGAELIYWQSRSRINILRMRQQNEYIENEGAEWIYQDWGSRMNILRMTEHNEYIENEGTELIYWEWGSRMNTLRITEQSEYTENEGTELIYWEWGSRINILRIREPIVCNLDITAGMTFKTQPIMVKMFFLTCGKLLIYIWMTFHNGEKRNILLWSKNIGTPALHCQIMHHLFIYFVCIGKTQGKGGGEKSQIWYHSTQNSKNGLDKIIGTLNIIFGSTPFGKNNWDQSLAVTINEFLSPLYWNFEPLFFCQLLQVSQIWRVPSLNCCFEISHRCSMGFRSGLIAGHFRTLLCFVLYHLCVLFEVCFG